MKVVYNLQERKPLVKALEEITGVKSVYKRAATYAYEIGYFTVTREGNLTFNDMADPDEIDGVLDKLKELGFTYESREYDELQPEIDTPEPVEDCPPLYDTPEETHLEVSLPIDKVNIENLKALLEAKGSLIKKSLGITELTVKTDDDKITFPWISETLDAESIKAYTHLIAGLCEMSIKQSRINAANKNVANEKYAFRCFLLRLGFIGVGYKNERKILLKNLTGSSAFKNGEKKESENDEISKQRCS